MGDHGGGGVETIESCREDDVGSVEWGCRDAVVEGENDR